MLSVPIHNAPSVENSAVLVTGITSTAAFIADDIDVWARLAAVNKSALVAIPLGYIAI